MRWTTLSGSNKIDIFVTLFSFFLVQQFASGCYVPWLLVPELKAHVDYPSL